MSPDPTVDIINAYTAISTGDFTNTPFLSMAFPTNINETRGSRTAPEAEVTFTDLLTPGCGDSMVTVVSVMVLMRTWAEVRVPTFTGKAMRNSSPVWPKELSSIVYEIHHTGTYMQHVRISETIIVESIWKIFSNSLKNYCRISTCVFVLVLRIPSNYRGLCNVYNINLSWGLSYCICHKALVLHRCYPSCLLTSSSIE